MTLQDQERDKETLRDNFAAQALNGLIAGRKQLMRVELIPQFVEWAYQLADAMMTERGKTPRKEIPQLTEN